MNAFPFAIVGFDLDGTLVDSAADLAAALNHALAAARRTPLPLARVAPMIGGGARHLLEQGMAATGGGDEAEVDALLPLLLAHYEANMTVHTRPFPGAGRAVDDLNRLGVRCAVVTNKREAFARLLLTDLGLLDLFVCVIGGDTLGAGTAKPAPDMLLAMVERCGGGPTAYVGDTRYDVASARAAGLPVVACAFDWSREDAETLGADAVIDHFDRLLPALSRVAT